MDLFSPDYGSIIACLAGIVLLLAPAIIGIVLCLKDYTLSPARKAVLCICFLLSGPIGLIIYLAARR